MWIKGCLVITNRKSRRLGLSVYSRGFRAAESLDQDICRNEMRALRFHQVGNDLITELSRQTTRRLFRDYNVLDPQSRPMH